MLKLCCVKCGFWTSRSNELLLDMRVVNGSFAHFTLTFFKHAVKILLEDTFQKILFPFIPMA